MWARFRPPWMRRSDGGELLERFLVSGIVSVLVIRWALALTGYPKLGGGGLHIAHMLWGGLLMLTAITLSLAFLGARVQRLSALLGGVGFGVFIDELGKFLTRDNNYFFRPTVGLIYAIFIILYLLFNSLSRVTRLTRREYELNALAQLEEAVLPCGMAAGLLPVLILINDQKFTKTANCWGVEVAVSTPMAFIFSFTSGSDMMRLISRFRRVTSAGGMPTGPKAPYHTDSS